jgi:uncharacterized membrane protein
VTLLATWTTAGPFPLWFGAVLAATALVLGALLYRPVLAARDHGVLFRRALLGLRILAIALAVLVVANPVLRFERAPRDAQRIEVLVDTSRSMALRDSLGGSSRVETAARILGPGKLLEELSTLGRVEVSGFDSTVHDFSVAHPAAAGESSDLAGAVARVSNKKDATPLAAVVILTDGCETGSKSVVDAAPPVPVYPIALGSLEEALEGVPDVALAGVRCDRSVLVKSAVEAQVELRAAHLDGERATVQLLKGEDVLAESLVVLGPKPIQVPLKFTPDAPGLLELEARVLPLEGERFPENNVRKFPLKVGAQVLRVLYYEGTPRWEYKFLSRELRKDAHLALEALLRTSGERAYEQGSASGGATSRFPDRRELLRRFDCVVLGDLDARALDAGQVEALRAYVGEDSGGLVVLAGRDSFGPEGLAALGLEPLLPVSLEGARIASGTFDVAAVPEALSHPALAGVSRFLPLESVFALGPLKPGAQLLAAAQTPEGALPLAVAQRYGAGRVFLFASDSDWKWVTKEEARGGRELFVRLWGQAIRWAANRDAEARDAQAALSTDKEIYRPGETVRLSLPGTSGRAEVEIDGERVPLVKGGAGLEASFVPSGSGLHRARAGESTCEFYVERAPGELDRLAVNEMLLERLAAATGGQCFDATRAGQVPAALRASGKLHLEVRELALGESWFVFAAIVLALGVEWALRKRAQVI